jgi:hypothetical protein
MTLGRQNRGKNGNLRPAIGRAHHGALLIYWLMKLRPDRALFASLFATPLHLYEITLFCVSKVQVAFVGVMECFADGSRQVDVRRFDHYRIRLLFNVHDAVKRMFSIFLLLLVPSQIENFCSTAYRKRASYGNYACRVPIVGTMTCLASLFVRVDWPGVSPLPTALFKDRTAIRTHGLLWKLAFSFIGVMNPLVNQAVHAEGSAILKSY